MRKTISIWLFICFLINGSDSFAQQAIEIPTPSIELEDHTIHINYDILHSQPEDRFNVQVEIRDQDGNLINAKAFDGDIGRNVSGGRNKTILWAYENDKILINSEILINVFAEKIVLESMESSSSIEDSPLSGNANRKYNRTSLILQSVALPGLGLTKTTGKPHWIKGVAAYGCLGGAMVLNRAAISTYDEFLSAESAESADALFSKSSRQDVISESLAYASIGIFVSDLIWTILGTSNQNNGAGFASHKKLSLKGGFSAIARSPILGFTYRF